MLYANPIFELANSLGCVSLENELLPRHWYVDEDIESSMALSTGGRGGGGNNKVDAGVLKDCIVLGVAVVSQFLTIEDKLLDGDRVTLVLLHFLFDLKDSVKEANLNGEIPAGGCLKDHIHGEVNLRVFLGMLKALPLPYK